VYAGVFVVVQIKKNMLKKTLFRLVGHEQDEFWVRLQRGNKAGVHFRPLRRVVAVNFEGLDSKGRSKDQSGGGNGEKYQVGAGFGSAAEGEEVVLSAVHGEEHGPDGENATTADYAALLNVY
jgi:hypothetical protein